MWPLVADHLAAAVVRTRKIELEEIKERCQSGEFQLWVIWVSRTKEALGAVVCDIQGYWNGRREARIICMGGVEMPRWRDRIDVIKDWARAEGCDALEIVGRRGWEKIYPDFELIETVISLEL